MSALKITPVSGKHSIDKVVFALEWASPLSVADFQRVYALQPSLNDVFPRVQFAKALTVTLEDNKTSTDLSEISGVLFDAVGKTEETSLSPSLQINSQHLVFQLPGLLYDSWSSVWKVVSDTLDKVLPEVMPATDIATVGLQYIDEFLIDGKPEDELRMDMLFIEDSPYITAAAMQSEGPWHCHQGFFEKVETPIAHRRLNNINIAIAKFAGKPKIQVILSHRAFLNTPIKNQSPITAESSGISSLMHDLHKADIESLKKLMTPDVLASIGMKTGE